MSKISVLGIGPGSRDYLLNITERKVREAEVLVGGTRALEIFDDLNKEKFEITGDLDKVKDYIERNYRDKKLAVLVSGDPGLYSLLPFLKRKFPPKELEVIPGISSLQLGFARLKSTWQDTEITSLHGNRNEKKLLELVKDNEQVVVFTDRERSPDFIARLLLEEGVQKRRGAVLMDLSYDSERKFTGSLEQIANREFDTPNLMVIADEQMEI